MKIFFSILLNSSILFIIALLLNTNTHPDSVIVLPSANIIDWWWQIYLLWGIVLWLLNYVVRPILKILSLPFFFFFYWIVIMAINAVILWLLQEAINNILMLPDFKYIINWATNFIIAVAIFTFLNILYSLLFNKK